MVQLLKSSIGRLRIIAFVEGFSFLIILFITMPLKYFFSIGQPNKVVGMLHGVLFLLYIYAVMQATFDLKWKKQKWFLALVVSVIPFGNFWADKKLFIE